MKNSLTLMSGVHATPGTIWSKQAFDLAANLKSVNCRHFKMQGPLGSLNEETSIKFLKRGMISGFVMHDPKFKDAASTMARNVRKLVDYGVDIVTVWIDESGLPEVIRLLHDNADLAPHLCGIIELTTTSPEETKKAHGCSRKTFVPRQAAAIAPYGMRHFVCAVDDAVLLRKSVDAVMPGKAITLYCPGIRVEGDEAGGQVMTATPLQAKEAGVDVVISERYIADASDPRVNYQHLLGLCS